MSDPTATPDAAPAPDPTPVQKADAPPPTAPHDALAKAHLFVAHSLALAVQDATDNLRHTTAVANTAIGVALTKFLATGDDRFLQAIAPAQASIAAANTALANVAATASTVLAPFTRPAS